MITIRLRFGRYGVNDRRIRWQKLEQAGDFRYRLACCVSVASANFCPRPLPMDKQLRQCADAGGIEKVHTTPIKNQLGCALRTHALKKMTVHSGSETERDRRASLARWQFADKSDGRLFASATQWEVLGLLQRIDGSADTGLCSPAPVAARGSAVEDQCILVKFSERTDFVFFASWLFSTRQL